VPGRSQCGEPAGAGAADEGAVGVDVAALGEKGGDIETILHVEDAPLAVELSAVGAAVTGAAPVVHGDDGGQAQRDHGRSGGGAGGDE